MAQFTEQNRRYNLVQRAIANQNRVNVLMANEM